MRLKFCTKINTLADTSSLSANLNVLLKKRVIEKDWHLFFSPVIFISIYFMFLFICLHLSFFAFIFQWWPKSKRDSDFVPDLLILDFSLKEERSRQRAVYFSKGLNSSKSLLDIPSYEMEIIRISNRWSSLKKGALKKICKIHWKTPVIVSLF